MAGAKTEGDLRDSAYRRLDWLLAGVVAVLIAVFVFAVATQLRVLDHWLNDPRFVVLQLIGVIAIVGLLIGVRRRLWGAGIVVFPVVLIYTCIVYWIFRVRWARWHDTTRVII